MLIVKDNPGIKIGEVSEAINITRPNLSPLLESMTCKNQIKKQQDKHDKRTIRLYITEKGERQINENFKTIEERINNTLGNYTEQEIFLINDCYSQIKKIILKEQ